MNNTQEHNAPQESVAAPQPQEPAAPAAEPQEEMVRIRVKQRTRVRTGKKRHRKRRVSARKVILIVLCIVVVLACAAAATYAILSQQGKQNMAAAPQSEEALTVKYKGDDYVYNDNVVSVMFEGIDDESGIGVTDRSCSDANFLLSLDTQTNDATVTVIPRDAMCEVEIIDGNTSFTSKTNLCLAYAQDADKKTCAKNVANSVSKILGDMPIKYYYALNVHAIEVLADAVGGVKVKALQSIPGTSIQKGQKVALKGSEAYSYVQYRDITVDESALDRQKRQKQFLEALFAKAKGLSVTKLVKLVGTVNDYSVTNIGASELTYLAGVFLAGGKGSVQINTITGTTKSKVYEEDGLAHEYVVLDKNSVKKAKIAAFYKKVAE